MESFVFMIEPARTQDKTLGWPGITAALLIRGEETDEMKGWKPKYILEGIPLGES